MVAKFKWLLLLVGVIAIVVVFRPLPYDWNDTAWFGLGLVGPLGFFGHLVTRGKHQRQAGVVLMDLGRDRLSKVPGPGPAAFWWFLTALVCFAGMLSQSSETGGLSGETLEFFSMGMVFLFLGGLFLHMWYEGRQLRENGISWYGSLFRWEKLQKCAWADDVLCLSVETPIASWSHSFRGRISSDQKEAVDQILRERLQAEQ